MQPWNLTEMSYGMKMPSLSAVGPLNVRTFADVNANFMSATTLISIFCHVIMF